MRSRILTPGQFNVTADEVNACTQGLVKQMANDNWKPDHIVGVTRGGLTPAVMLSHYYGAPMTTVRIQLRDGNDITFDEKDYLIEKAGKVLIVDDINDEGYTLTALSEKNQHLKKAKYGVLINNTESIFSPDYAGFDIIRSETPHWFNFPWENWEIR